MLRCLGPGSKPRITLREPLYMVSQTMHYAAPVHNHNQFQGGGDPHGVAGGFEVRRVIVQKTMNRLPSHQKIANMPASIWIL